MAYYIDTSAAAGLVVREPETVAFARWLHQHEGGLFGSDLMRTELMRTARRSASDAISRARIVVDSFTLLTLTTATFERAAALDPPELRSLDALHLAVALELGDQLDGVVTYDDRLAAGADALGIATVAPT